MKEKKGKKALQKRVERYKKSKKSKSTTNLTLHDSYTSNNACLNVSYPDSSEPSISLCDISGHNIPLTSTPIARQVLAPIALNQIQPEETIVTPRTQTTIDLHTVPPDRVSGGIKKSCSLQMH